MALIKCPECGNDVSDQANACPHCGYEMAVRNEPATEDKKEVPVHKKSISILMLIMGCVLLLLSITRVKNDDYKFYQYHYQECMDGYIEAKAAAYSYSAGYFRDSYNSIASSFKELADDDKKEIWKFRIQAIALIGGGFVLIICGFCNYKKGKNKNGTNKMS